MVQEELSRASRVLATAVPLCQVAGMQLVYTAVRSWVVRVGMKVDLVLRGSCYKRYRRSRKKTDFQKSRLEFSKN